ncbi:MAG: HDOD domain-containing protein [Kofleriaceae bacterium]
MVIDDAGFDAYLRSPAELVACFHAPSYRPPVLPTIALEIHELSRRRICDFRDVKRLLERDPMVAAQVLKTAQSPLFATRTPVRSLDDALNRIGLDMLAQIVFEVTMGMTLFRQRGYEAAMDRVRKHSTATAYFARAIAHATKQPTELAFMCGLFHDIGVVACLLVFAKPSPGSGIPTFEEVWPIIDPIHAEVSRLLAQLWKLPPEVQAVLSQDHRPQLNDSGSTLSNTVFVADALAAELGVGLEEGPEPALVDTIRAQIGLSDAVMPDLMTYAKSVATQIV